MISSAATALCIVASDSGLRVKLMQKALIGRGYFVGPAGADGEFNEHTMTALEAFQDNNALPIAPQCDQQCWNELSPSNAKTALPWEEPSILGRKPSAHPPQPLGATMYCRPSML